MACPLDSLVFFDNLVKCIFWRALGKARSIAEEEPRGKEEQMRYRIVTFDLRHQEIDSPVADKLLINA